MLVSLLLLHLGGGLGLERSQLKSSGVDTRLQLNESVQTWVYYLTLNQFFSYNVKMY
jgi:hypothetical protein